MDRGVVTGMVEDYWRAVIPASQSDPSAAIGVTKRFEERVEETARLLQPVEAAAFRQAVDAERERLLQEYQANPAALKRRLGVPLGVDAEPPLPPFERTGRTGSEDCGSRDSLGEHLGVVSSVQTLGAKERTSDDLPKNKAKAPIKPTGKVPVAPPA